MEEPGNLHVPGESDAPQSLRTPVLEGAGGAEGGQSRVPTPATPSSGLPPQDFPWILADEQDVHMHDPRLIPLKTMTSDILKVSSVGARYTLFRVC